MSSFLRLERKQTISSIAFRIRKFLLRSYSFGIETIMTRSYTPVVPSKSIPDSRPKWAKCIPVFRPERTKNPTLLGGTYLYGLYRGVPPPGGIHPADKLGLWVISSGISALPLFVPAGIQESIFFCYTVDSLLTDTSIRRTPL